ncbi:MAG TPA: Ig-like domain-containing protein [Caldilinea sp.]|nr:Ig-like domain-containing protein [Caldilinea sp.]
MPTADQNGMPYATFQFAASDGFATSALHTLTFIVRPVNDAPVAVDDFYPVAMAAQQRTQPTALFTIPVLENDYDVD